MDTNVNIGQEDRMSGDQQNEDLQGTSETAIYGLRLQELRSEINKGWSGRASKRSVRDILKSKTSE